MTLRLILVLYLTFMPLSSNAKNLYGVYSGNVKAEWLKDGRRMKLLENFSYKDPNNVNWQAPKGSIVDGASIPTFAWSFIGSPFSGKYRNASVIHDIACQNKDRTWEVVHLSFYYGMLASDVSKLKAKIMYAAVYHFGPRWPIGMKVQNPMYNTKSTEKFLCSQKNGNSICSSNALYDPRPEVVIEIPPQEKTLTLESFEKLALEIENGESHSSPLSLEDIANWSNEI